MIELLLLAATAAQAQGPILFGLDPQPGPMPVESRTLSQPHRNQSDTMFPDLAVKAFRIEGGTLHVLVANEGGTKARGPIQVRASAESSAVRTTSAVTRTAALDAGESRWVPLKNFAARTASTGPARVTALEDTTMVSATVRQAPAVPRALDRTGQASDDGAADPNEANDSLTLAGSAILGSSR